jgi:hypothetical protein
MNFDLFSRSKYRVNDKSGDDVALVLPGVCFGVLDGATDAEGTGSKWRSLRQGCLNGGFPNPS